MSGSIRFYETFCNKKQWLINLFQSIYIYGTHYYWQSHPPKIWLIFFLLMLLRGCQNQVWAPSKSIYVKFRYSRSIFWWKICPIFIFSSVFEHLHLGPLGGIWKKWKSAYLTPFPSFLLKNKHTFFSKTFHFHPEYTFWFLKIFVFSPQI